MRRFITLFATGMVALTAHAQNVQQIGNPSRKVSPPRPESAAATTVSTPARPTFAHAKVTAITTFFLDTFNAFSLSTGGWVAGGNTPAAGTWKFSKTAANGAFAISKINSTTSAGGWMIYDSDSIGAIFNGSPQVGTLTSPVINCTIHPYVGVRFQQYTRRYQDTFMVQVSNNGGSSWTSYPIPSAMALGTNDFTANPDVSLINITPVAGGQANVKVRFYYSGAFVGGGYNWYVDDFEMVNLDPVDLGLSNSGFLMTLGGGTGFTPVGTRPTIFADSVFPVTEASNFGGQAVSAVSVNANIYAGASSVYNKNYAFSGLPINAFDSIADYTALPGYVPAAAPAQYIASFGVHATGDANASNDVDTAVFTVSDSSLCVFSGYREATKTLNPFFYESNYYLHAPAGTGRPNGASYYMGSFFELPTGARKDTITSVSVCIAPNTTVGSQIQVELYKYDPTTPAWNSLGRSFVKTLTAADISTTTSLVFTTLEMNIGAAKAYTITGAGTYGVVALPVSPTTAQTILIASATNGAPANIVGSYGISDSANGTAFNFGSDLGNNFNYNLSDDVPAVVVNYGDATKLRLGVDHISGLNIGSAYPNPANTSLNIPVGAIVSTPVTVGLFNMMGQLLKTQDLGLIPAGQSKSAVFSTSELAAGVYMYTIESNGQRMTNRVVVAH